MKLRNFIIHRPNNYMPIQIHEIREEDDDHHHHNNNRRHGEVPDNNPQSSIPPRPYPKSNPESGTRKLICLFFKCVIMILIFSLFLLFLGFAALVLIHFLLTSSAGRRRLRQRQSGLPRNPTSTYSVEDLQSLLPHLSYDGAAQTVRDCAICLDSFRDGEACRKLPDCNHLFHMNCGDNWLTKVPNCPICRTRVRLDSVSSDDERKVWWAVDV